MAMKNHLLSFGHGYSAQTLGRILISQDWSITGTTRDSKNLVAIETQGATAVLWPDTDLSDAISGATHILISAAPTDAGDPVLATFKDQIAAIGSQLKWVGYLSTTGVYGDHKGAVVDEETPLKPTVKRGNLRAIAEAEWQALANDAGFPLHIFRLAGIYGPGRGPFAKVRAGTARCIIKENQFFSRIHVEDIANVLAASIAQPVAGGRVYNVCDNEPAPPQDVLAHAARLLGLPVPPDEDFETAEMHPMARSFYSESRKVSNARIRNELGVTMLYPTYREGLQALLDSESEPI